MQLIQLKLYVKGDVDMPTNQFTMQDPRSQYQMGRTEKDSDQPDPGLDEILKPKADHGEDTYVGSDRLKGRKALITGGDSGIGRAGCHCICQRRCRCGY